MRKHKSESRIKKIKIVLVVVNIIIFPNLFVVFHINYEKED